MRLDLGNPDPIEAELVEGGTQASPNLPVFGPNLLKPSLSQGPATQPLHYPTAFLLCQRASEGSGSFWVTQGRSETTAEAPSSESDTTGGVAGNLGFCSQN